MSNKLTKANEALSLTPEIMTLDTPIHIVWTGAGDMLKKSFQAIEELVRRGAKITFVDICDIDEVRQPPPPACEFYNITLPERRRMLRELLREQPVTHLYIATWPEFHLPMALKYADSCQGGMIVIPKPLDTNFTLIDTIASASLPGLAHKIFVHDHYRNKAVVGHMYDAFPKLKHYGEVTEFEFFLLEYRTIEQEQRLKALAKGVIFDLMSHLFALVQMFFIAPPHVAVSMSGATVQRIDIRINQVARARYINCGLPNDIETFAAISVTIIVRYKGNREIFERPIHGLLVAGKGVKPTQSVQADVKGMRFKLALGNRSANLSTGAINPPLADLDFISESNETGFYQPVINGLSQKRPEPKTSKRSGRFSELMSFAEARENSLLLQQSILKGSSLTYYRRQSSTLSEILSDCVRAGNLSADCLLKGEPFDIGYSA